MAISSQFYIRTIGDRVKLGRANVSESRIMEKAKEKAKEIVGRMIIDVKTAEDNLKKAALEYARALEASRKKDDEPELRRV